MMVVVMTMVVVITMMVVITMTLKRGLALHKQPLVQEHRSVPVSPEKREQRDCVCVL